MPKVAELTVEELKSIIHDTVEESINELFEDMLAMASPIISNRFAKRRKILGWVA